MIKDKILTEQSDLDLLVIEIVRLRRALRPLKVPVDVLVVSQEMFDYWRDTPGSIYFEAASEGKILYEEKAA